MKKLRVLSLDGGGVKGYLTALLLADIEIHLNENNEVYIPLGKYFDLIVGTSTGAIIAGLLAIGKTAKEIKNIYRNDIPFIFSNDMKNCKFNYLKSKYQKKNLEEKAKEYFGDKTFSKKDLIVDLIVTSVDITTAKPRLYKSNYLSKNNTRIDEKLADAIVASASAPTYFPITKEMEYSSYLIDGGVVANNPSLIALIDGVMLKKERNFENIVLVSIGTGKVCEMPYDVQKLEDTQLGWIINKKAIIELLMASQSNIAEFQTEFLAKELGIEYKRINPNLGQKIELDNIDKISILKNIGNLIEQDIGWMRKNLIK